MNGAPCRECVHAQDRLECQRKRDARVNWSLTWNGRLCMLGAMVLMCTGDASICCVASNLAFLLAVYGALQTRRRLLCYRMRGMDHVHWDDKASRRMAGDAASIPGVTAMVWVLTDAGMGEVVYPVYEGRPAVFCRDDGSIHTGIDGGRSTTYADMLSELERHRVLRR